MPTYFSISSALNGFVLDVEGASMGAGTRVITYSNNEADNQLWYHDVYSGAIRSKADHDFALDVADGDLVINPFDPHSESQKFDFEGDHIYQRGDHGKVLDVADNDESEGARVCLCDRNEGPNQCWTINRQQPLMNGLVTSGGSADAGAATIMQENGNDNKHPDEDNITSNRKDCIINVQSDDVTARSDQSNSEDTQTCIQRYCPCDLAANVIWPLLRHILVSVIIRCILDMFDRDSV